MTNSSKTLKFKQNIVRFHSETIVNLKAEMKIMENNQESENNFDNSINTVHKML